MTARGRARRAPRLGWGLRAFGIDALWRRGLTGAGVTVGHLDTGVAAEHPALAGRVAGFAEFDLGGRAVAGAAPRDTGSHGTHTAGIICGGAAGGERIGVAPDTRLRSAAVIDGGHNVARIIRGLDWLRGSGVGVVCMALGLPGDNPVLWTMLAALRAQDVVIVAPVGNLGPRFCHAPASYPGVLAVGAVGEDNATARFTGCARDDASRCRKPELLAPGEDIASAHPRRGGCVESGTSQAAAFVAGVAALLRQAYPDATAYQIEQALCHGARPIDASGEDQARTDAGGAVRYRFGVVQPAAALALLATRDRLPRYRRVPRDPPQYRDPALLAACRMARDDERIDCVIVAAREVRRTRRKQRGPRGGRGQRLVEDIARKLGEDAPEASYFPRAGAAIVSASRRLIRALAADARVRVLSATAARVPPLPL